MFNYQYLSGLGNGLIFKLVPSYFAKESGNGIVSMMGGLGGFFPPLVITYVTGLTGSSHLAFILLAIFGVLAFITMGHLYKKNMQNKFIKSNTKLNIVLYCSLTFYSVYLFILL